MKEATKWGTTKAKESREERRKQDIESQTSIFTLPRTSSARNGLSTGEINCDSRNCSPAISHHLDSLNSFSPANHLTVNRHLPRSFSLSTTNLFPNTTRTSPDHCEFHVSDFLLNLNGIPDNKVILLLSHIVTGTRQKTSVT